MGCNCEDDKHKPFTEYSLVKAGMSVIKHFTDPEYDAFVNEKQKEDRMKACNDCDMLTTLMGAKQCLVCRCFVEAKSALRDQGCPHPSGSKWPKL